MRKAERGERAAVRAGAVVCLRKTTAGPQHQLSRGRNRTIVLGVDSIGIDDGLALGGDSLLAMQLLSRIQQVLHIVVPASVFFTTNLTVAEVAQAVLKEQASAPNPFKMADLLKRLAALTGLTG